MVKPLHPRDKDRPTFFVFTRLFLITILSLFPIVFAYYKVASFLVEPLGIAAAMSVFFGIPFFIGAWSVFLFDINSDKSAKFYFWFPLLCLTIVIIIGSFILREGVLCVVMLSPLWGICAVMGAYMVRRLKKNFKDRSTLSCSVIALIPLLTLFFDAFFPLSTQHRQVSRDIIINAPITSVWPKLLQVENIEKAEGRWNFTQDVLGLPRPKAALFEGHKVGAVRTSHWEEEVIFEEHITRQTPPHALEWNFVFPNDSLQMHTDKHISPDGKVLKIKNGGYQLTSLNRDKTKLTLYTDYQMTVPFNSYSALWGEIILGDIQNNILSVIKTRAETGRLSPP